MQPESPPGYVLLRTAQLEDLQRRAGVLSMSAPASLEALSVVIGLLTAKVCGLPSASWPVADTVDPAALISTLITFTASALGQILTRDELLDVLQSVALEAALKASET